MITGTKNGSLAPVPRIGLSTDDAAKALGISKRRLLELRADGSIPYVEIGPQTFVFDPADLEKFLAQRKKGGDGVNHN